MSDIFNYEYKIEFQNLIDIQTFADYDSSSYAFSNKFNINKLSLIKNEQFEIIPNNIPFTKDPILAQSGKNKVEGQKNLNKKRGRHIKVTSKIGRKNPHDRKCSCNIRTKITIAYFSFLVQFINSIIELILCEEDGVDISQYKLKKIKHSKNINLQLIKNLKKAKIKDIFSFQIDSKNIFGEKTENEEICKKNIEKNEKLENIFNQCFIEFFENIFCQKNREVNLNKYGINKNLFLNSNVILYKDFINNIKSKENDGDNLEEYLKLIDEGVKNYMKI